VNNLEIGTLLEPKYDHRVGHAVILEIESHIKNKNPTKLYLVERIKSKERAVMYEKEIYDYYNPINSKAAKALYGVK